MSKSYIFYIRGMTCGSCAGIIENVLTDTYTTNLELFKADIISDDPKKTLLVLNNTDTEDHQSTWEKIRIQIEDLGYNCEPYDYLPFEDQAPSPTETSEVPSTKPSPPVEKSGAWLRKILKSHWFQGILGCSTGIALLITMLVTGGLPLVALIPIAIISSLLTLFLGAHSYYDAWKKLKAKSLTMDTLFAISTLIVLIVSCLSFYISWLPMMFEAGLLIFGFRHIGIAIEETIKEKISSSKFQDRSPKVVNLLMQNTPVKTPLYKIKPNDILLVYPGDLIPLDGICLEETYLYDTITTGAILPSQFKAGNPILAGMRVSENSSPVRIQVTKNLKESYLARLDVAIADSLTQKTPLEIKTQKILTYFIPTVIGLAITSGILVSFFFPAATALLCAIAVLVSACPCTLGLIIPLAAKTGIQKAAEQGIQFKKSRIQDPEQIDTVVFDLHGTLTRGVPKVRRCFVVDGMDIAKPELLSICSALEEKSEHPIGKAIYAYSKRRRTSSQLVKNLDNSYHSGISGEIEGSIYIIGSATLMRKKGISTADIEQKISLKLKPGDSMTFIARRDHIVGYVVMQDPLRQHAKLTIQALKEMGKDVILCTGADKKTAARYAKELGIKKVYSSRTASTLENSKRSKPALIQALKKKGLKVTMVGDGGNDTEALARCDFGIAVGGDEITQQHAGAIIKGESLFPIVHIFSISQRTVSTINHNLMLSFAYNFISILLAGGLLLVLGFTLPPVVGVILMALQACTIFYNVYCFKNESLEFDPHEMVLANESSKTENRLHGKLAATSKMTSSGNKDNQSLHEVSKVREVYEDSSTEISCHTYEDRNGANLWMDPRLRADNKQKRRDVNSHPKLDEPIYKKMNDITSKDYPGFWKVKGDLTVSSTEVPQLSSREALT